MRPSLLTVHRSPPRLMKQLVPIQTVRHWQRPPCLSEKLASNNWHFRQQRCTSLIFPPTDRRTTGTCWGWILRGGLLFAGLCFFRCELSCRSVGEDARPHLSLSTHPAPYLERLKPAVLFVVKLWVAQRGGRAASFLCNPLDLSYIPSRENASARGYGKGFEIGHLVL